VEVLALLVIAYFIGRYLADHWGEIRSYDWELSAVPLLYATALAVLALVLFGAIWTALLNGMGERTPLRQGLSIWFVSNLARYVPGKVWQISGVAYLSSREGINPIHAIGASLLSQVLVLAIAALLLVVLLPLELSDLYGPAVQGALVAAGVGLLAFFVLPIFDAVYARLVRLLGQPAPPVRLSLMQKLLFGGGTALAWAFFALSFWFFLQGTVGRAPPPTTAAGIFIAGYLGGFLVFLAPGGLGVREGIFTLLLKPYLTPSVALGAAVLCRVWLTLLELALALAVSVIASRGRVPPAGRLTPSNG
jgi:uncharacterized membrane protein YbhN (UPF0104 family)